MNEFTRYIALTDLSFQKDVLQSSTPVLVEFGADWCGGCHILAPAIRELLRVYENAVKVIQIDFEANGSVTEKYGVHKIPTLLLFKDGSVVEHIVGAVPKKELLEKLGGFISPKPEKQV
jgi:thioredoxin 1